jgi:hypothetical protein
MINQFSNSLEVANDLGNPIPVGSSPTAVTGAYTFGTSSFVTSGPAGAFFIVVSSLSGVCVGQTVSGTGINPGATVISISTATNTISLSLANTASVVGQTVSFTMAAGAILASGTLNLNRTIGLVISTIGSGMSLSIQVSNDGTNFSSLTATQVSSGTGVMSTAIAAVGAYRANASGFVSYRLIQNTAITAGTCVFGIALSTGSVDSAQPITITSGNSNVGYSNSAYYQNVTAASGVAVTTTSIKNVSGNIGLIHISNLHNTTAFVKLFDSATTLTSSAANPPLFGTNAKLVVGAAAGQHVAIPIPIGLRFTSGVQIFISQNPGLTDGTTLNTASAATASLVYA